MTNIVAKLRLANEISLNHHEAGREILPGLVRDIAKELGTDARTINLLIGGGMTKQTTDEGILEILLDLERNDRYEQLKGAFVSGSDRFADRSEND